MFRLESYQIAKDRHAELLRDAERARFAARINRPEHGPKQRRLRLPTLRSLTFIRQA